MLRSTKDYWQRKAQDDYLQAENDEQRQKAIDMNQAAWKKRVDESRWLLKNTPTEGVFSDASLKENLEKHARRKYVDMDLDDSLKKKEKKKKRRGINAWRHNLIALMKAKNGDFTAENDEDEDDVKRLSKYEQEQKRKAELAKKMREADERKEREAVLQANIDRIKVLERVVHTLKRPRIPKHHRPVQEMKGYVPEETAISSEVKEINAYGYVQPQVPRPVEQLKSVQQIMKEDTEASLFHVPERYHHYLGLDKIYPLKAFPSTLKALFSGPPAPEKIPEILLLPQASSTTKSKVEMEVETEFIQRKRALSKIKRNQLDMSRLQFRIPDDAIIPSSSSAKDEDRKISQQFPYKHKDFVDENSVYAYPHPAVEFKQHSTKQMKVMLPSIGSSNESMTIPTLTTGLQYEYLPSSSSSNTSLADDHSAYLLGQPMGSGPLPADHLIVDDDDNYAMEEEVDHNSEYAVRSNYHSEHSTRGDQLIPVRMERLRTVKKLTDYHVKESFQLISRRKKEKILAEKKFAEEG